MRRGEIWQYRPVLERPGQSLLRLIVSADFLNEGDGATVLGVHLIDRDPQSLLAPRHPHARRPFRTANACNRAR